MPLPVAALSNGRVSCSDVVRCAFDLSEQEIRAYEALNDRGPSRVEDLAADLGREASVVYRHLQALSRCGIVAKRKETIEGGGYRFIYDALPKRKVKAKLAACVDDWHAQMTRAIARL